MATRAQGAIRRVGLEGLVWWERGLRWLQGQGGGRGVLCTVNDVAPLPVEKQGLVDIPVKYVTPRTVDLGTTVAFAILSYPNSVELWRARIAVFLSSRCCRWLCGGAIVSVITLTRRYHNRAKTFRTRLYFLPARTVELAAWEHHFSQRIPWRSATITARRRGVTSGPIIDQSQSYTAVW